MSKKLTLGFSPYGTGTDFPFNRIFHKTEELRDNPDLEGIDALVLWGGRDINSSFYKAAPHPSNQAKTDGDSLVERDRVEWHWLHAAKKKQIPVIGICRGAQLMCAFAGGSLFQHVGGHDNQPHLVQTLDGETLMTNSYHHQMMDVTGTKHEVLAWSKTNLSPYYDKEGFDSARKNKPLDGLEPEVVFFPDIQGFAIQGHPEWLPATSKFNDWVLQNTKDFLNL